MPVRSFLQPQEERVVEAIELQLFSSSSSSALVSEPEDEQPQQNEQQSSFSFRNFCKISSTKIAQFTLGFAVGVLAATVIGMPMFNAALEEARINQILPNNLTFYEQEGDLSHFNEEMHQFLDPNFLNPQNFYLYYLKTISEPWAKALEEMGFVFFKGGWISSRIHRIVSGFFDGARGEAALFCRQIQNTSVFSNCLEALNVSKHEDGNCSTIKEIFSGFIKKEISRLKLVSIEKMICGHTDKIL